MNLINGVTKNEKSDEWYTPLPTAKKCYELLNLDPALTIMCPYDNTDSNFVKHARLIGHKVIFNIDDFLTKDYDFDAVVTNPPFSIKDKVIERVLKAGKPAALIMPIDSLGGVARRRMFSTYGYPSIYVPMKRINYVDGIGLNRKAANFHSIIMLLNRDVKPLLMYEKWGYNGS